MAERDYGQGTMAVYRKPRQEEVTTIVPTD
jgi:hypothetical protein